MVKMIVTAVYIVIGLVLSVVVVKSNKLSGGYVIKTCIYVTLLWILLLINFFYEMLKLKGIVKKEKKYKEFTVEKLKYTIVCKEKEEGGNKYTEVNIRDKEKETERIYIIKNDIYTVRNILEAADEEKIFYYLNSSLKKGERHGNRKI